MIEETKFKLSYEKAVCLWQKQRVELALKIMSSLLRPEQLAAFWKQYESDSALLPAPPCIVTSDEDEAQSPSLCQVRARE